MNSSVAKRGLIANGRRQACRDFPVWEIWTFQTKQLSRAECTRGSNGQAGHIGKCTSLDGRTTLAGPGLQFIAFPWVMWGLPFPGPHPQQSAKMCQSTNKKESKLSEKQIIKTNTWKTKKKLIACRDSLMAILLGTKSDVIGQIPTGCDWWVTGCASYRWPVFVYQVRAHVPHCGWAGRRCCSRTLRSPAGQRTGSVNNSTATGRTIFWMSVHENLPLSLNG